MKRDYAMTFAAEAAVIASYLLVFRLVAHELGPTGFGEYSLARRTLTLLVPIGMVGVDVGIARFLSYGAARGRTDPAYVLAGFILISAGVLVISGVLITFHQPLADLLYGSPKYDGLIWPLPVLLAGSAVSIVSYAALRGRLRTAMAAILMVASQAVIPLIAVLVTKDVTVMLVLTGTGWLVVSAPFLFVAGFSGARQIGQRIGELARFGVPRIPGDVLQVALFTVPGIVVAHTSDIRVAGVVALMIAGVRMVGSALTPVSFVLLPAASRLMARGSYREVRNQVSLITTLAAAILLAGTLVVEVGAPQIVDVYLGAGFRLALGVMRVLMLGALPFGLFAVLRSVIDAHHETAINARNTTIAFTLLVAGVAFGYGVGQPTAGAVGGFVLALYVLMSLTILEVIRIPLSPPVSGSGLQFEGILERDI